MPEITRNAAPTLSSPGVHRLAFCIIRICILLLCTVYSLQAQVHPSRNVIWDLKLQRQVAFLSDDICEGRATGTRGGTEAASFIARRFRDIGLEPIHGGKATKASFNPFSLPAGLPDTMS